tara:strand:+ start:420 stop:542 length:123 start_codon:yes stop_codon:yes gene_type:complete
MFPIATGQWLLEIADLFRPNTLQALIVRTERVADLIQGPH